MSAPENQRNAEHERLVRLFLNHQEIKGLGVREAAKYLDDVSYGTIARWRRAQAGQEQWHYLNSNTVRALKDFLTRYGDEPAG